MKNQSSVICKSCSSPIEGLDQDWLIEQKCNACYDEDYRNREIQIEKEKNLAERSRRRRHYMDICPKSFLKTKRKNLPGNQDTIIKILGWNRKNGLLIYGPTGTGKTRTCWLLIKELIIDRGFRCFYFRATDLARKIESSSYADGNHNHLIGGLIDAECLIIDDLFKQKMTERQTIDLFDIIDGRMQNGSPSIFTTNETGETLLSKNNPSLINPILRRLRDYCTKIRLNKKTK